MNSKIRSVDQSIGNFVKKYYSLLNTYTAFPLKNLYPLYFGISSALHKLAKTVEFDHEAFGYAFGRLPPEIINTDTVIFAKHQDDLGKANIILKNWLQVKSPSRKRISFYNQVSRQLIFFINSKSDIDDLLSCLLAFQIEWNKLTLDTIPPDLKQILPKDISFFKANISVKKIKSSYTYQQIYQNWWASAQNKFLIYDFKSQPIYFVSSNSHSLINIIGGFTNLIQDKVFEFIRLNHPDIYDHYTMLKAGQNSLRINDLLYYMSALFLSSNQKYHDQMLSYHQDLGIRQIEPFGSIPHTIQIIPIDSLLKSKYLDPQIDNIDKITDTKGLIINIDYPLGMSAHYLLNAILQNNNQVKGVYIVGKAAILKGQPGDMQIPKTVFDERTGNIFNIDNCFNKTNLTSNQFEIHTNQKAVTVYGTFFENSGQLNNYQKTDINIIEMESAPYLLSVAKAYKNITKPVSQIINLNDLPLDLGIINYASDNPLGQTLGAGALGIKGISSTYLSLLTVLQQIINIQSRQ